MGKPTIDFLANAKPKIAYPFLLLFCGVYLACVSAGQALTITAQPQNQTVRAGSNVTFTVAASGSGPLSYTWRFNNTDIPGQPGPTLTLTNVQSAQPGGYDVLISDGVGIIVSSMATLTVLFPPSFSGIILEQALPAGTNFVLIAPVSGTAPLSYQWRRNAGNLSGETHRILSLTNIQVSDNGEYSVVATNLYGAVTGVVARLSIGFFLTVSQDGLGTVSWDPQKAIYPPGTIVVISALPANVFENWSGDAVGTNNPLIITMNTNKTIIANFNSTTLRLAVVGNGSIVTSPNQALFPRSSSVTLTAIPEVGYGFVTWTGDASGTNNPLQIIMDRSKFIVARFVGYTLDISTIGSGSVEVEPNQRTFPPLATAALRAIPAPGFGFLNWSGAVSGNMNPLLLFMNTNKAVTANFIPTAVSITISGSGTVKKTPDKLSYEVGENVALTAIPRPGFAFVHWGDGPTNNPRMIMIGLSNSYAAIFSATTAVETISFGNVSRTAPVGTPAVFVDADFVVTGAINRTNITTISIQTTFERGTIFYSLDGSAPSGDSRWYSGPFVLQRSGTIRALAYDANFSQFWEADPIQLTMVPFYSMTATTEGGGSVALLPGAGPYPSNTTISVVASPFPGWDFLQWIGEGNSQGRTNSVLMNRSKCAQAVFGTSLQTITSGSGAILVDPAASRFPYDYEVTLTAVPQPGNHFVSWGNAGSGTNNPLRFRITEAKPTVSCLFTPLATGQFALTVIPNGNGQVLMNPQANRYNNGQSVTLTAVPGPDQSFLNWDGDVRAIGNSVVISMNQSKIITANFTHRSRLGVWKCGDPPSEGFQLLLTGQLGARFQVEQSADLASWMPWATLTNAYGSLQLNDPFPDNPSQRFYRAVPAP